ncbi:ABC transporter substrate-binding protein [Sediminivirga luteola]|jgi:putative spermidine/putrescine transport system substrate-binding protein|uniref:ABC transporter substrate-binding protein n=1 Tax=Sediminivirga luteola TaxID=1774748 RepID=A0A8J2TVT1_9MICO|nr:ABC transporter substrate-binding protein [Sediminivirga luteola]MCI2264313.1 ABC transporter substrate-binding protein [Sediminivirga luteola]GGA05268.1 ABC transporter substrate-binding protein [Sediminivirga luteola]
MSVLAAAAASTLLFGCAGGSAGTDSDVSLTVVTWGGTTEEGIAQSVAEPFTDRTGIPVQLVNPVDYGQYAAQIQQDQVTWDIVDTEGWFNEQNPDWWAPIDRDIVQYDDADVIPIPGMELEDRNLEYRVPTSSYSFTIAYRTDHDGPHPTTWEEFFDTEAIPGARAVYNWPYGMLEVALLGDGVPFEELYPLDVDRAFEKLDSVRDDLVFWNSGAELQQMMTTGEAPFAYAWNNRITVLEKDGVPVTNEWNENLQDAGGRVVPHNAPHLNESMEFLGVYMEPEPNAQMAQTTGYSPGLQSAFDLIPDEEKPYYNVYPENLEQAVGAIDHEWWGENYDEVTQRWQEWAGQ